ncbi:MAG: hypothetical protein ACE5HP_11265 [Gemmatimonadota bacterium]
MREQITQAATWVERIFTDLVQASLLGQAIGTLVVLIFAVLTWLGVRLFFRRLDRRIAAWEGIRIRALKWQDQEILSQEDTSRITRGLGRWVSYAVSALLI